MKWHEISELPKKYDIQVLLYSPDIEPKFRIVVSQFVYKCTAATHWCYIKKPKNS